MVRSLGRWDKRLREGNSTALSGRATKSSPRGGPLKSAPPWVYASHMEKITLSASFSVPGAKLYQAWLDPVHHAAMSYGGDAAIDARVGGSHSTGDGYITGTFVGLVPGKRIVQTWRTSDFPEDQADSQVELTFTDTDEGGRIDLVHTGLPDEQVESYRNGWIEFYLQPMARYFGGQGPL